MTTCQTIFQFPSLVSQLRLGRFFIDWSLGFVPQPLTGGLGGFPTIDFKRLGFSFFNRLPLIQHQSPICLPANLPIYFPVCSPTHLPISSSPLSCPTRHLTTPITLVNNPLVFLSLQLQQQHSLSVFLYSTLAFTLYAAPTSDAAFTPQATLSSYAAIYLLCDFYLLHGSPPNM